MRWLLLVAYVLTVPLANWTISHVGWTCVPNGPCLIPVWPGIDAPSGVLWIGIALTLRDLVHQAFGRGPALMAIGAGALLSAAVSPAPIVVASTGAFLLSELADFAAYDRLYRRGWMAALVASNAVGLVIDSAVFLWVAFGSLDFMAGQLIGKAWMSLLAVIVLWSWRRQRRVVAAAA